MIQTIVKPAYVWHLPYFNLSGDFDSRLAEVHSIGTAFTEQCQSSGRYFKMFKSKGKSSFKK